MRATHRPATGSTLRFRQRDEVVASLGDHGVVVDDVRDAPDRSRRELVHLARSRDRGADESRERREAQHRQ